MRIAIGWLIAITSELVFAQAAVEQPQHFAIHVVDRETRRGVPLVELRTVHGIVHVTDSAGWIAFAEPGLMGREVYFDVASHGYSVAADGFGFRGVRLTTTPGATATVEVDRENVAERLYRVTGQGIYRDSVLLGREAPIAEPLLNARVLGQDSVQAVVYRGRIHWIWGDTNRESYPLGLFEASGATSPLPGAGGLPPSEGVDLRYFAGDDGFSRALAPIEGPGAVWLDGLLVVEDPEGEERMLAHYARMKSLGERLEHGLCVYDDAAETFVKLVELEADTKLHPRGQAVHATVDGERFVYFAAPFPTVRVRAHWEHVVDPARYEAFTPLAQGSGLDDRRVERDAEGEPVWAWRRDTAAVDAGHELAAGRLRIAGAPGAESVVLHSGSVRWNDFRRRWIMIALQAGGDASFLGEVWFAEAGALTGPWTGACKIVTHDRYSFYNPTQHGFFDEDGGRVVYFEGTYSKTFSATASPTPRYDYNQILYRLDLASPRLGLAPR